MTGEEGYLRRGWVGVNWSILVIYLIDFVVHTHLFTNIMCLLQIYSVYYILIYNIFVLLNGYWRKFGPKYGCAIKELYGITRVLRNHYSDSIMCLAIGYRFL